MTTTVSAIYDTYGDATAAVERVKAAGVPANDISLVSNDAGADRAGYADYRYPGTSEAADGAGTGAGLGVMAGAAGGLLAGLGIIAIPGLGPVVAAGWLASTLVGATAVGVAGGIVGALVGSGVDERDAHAYAEGVRRGGTLVNARVPDADRNRIKAVLDSGSYSLAERDRTWRDEGWSGRYPNDPI
ncbi:hypothetical protein [Phreatobacter stygius]|uniref:General stress protein 17M-like domain-containing protein n=1 Tax=Phreatobacter stygius TaxID=1940610 RepID=A0A4D7B507_9HYPH|nr:hypothetical protein [Phreatobacter stygius]QCI68494.1 hypothetical protein E8M01_32275 [Phreatobacter stygius]